MPFMRWSPTWLERFRSRVTIGNEGGHWLWIAATDSAGYGALNIGSEFGTVRVHRLSYMLYKGKVPDGLVIDHICRVRN